MIYVRDDKKDLWEQYIAYLHEWAYEHNDKAYEGMSPVCFDEYCDNEGANE